MRNEEFIALAFKLNLFSGSNFLIARRACPWVRLVDDDMQT
jgi:hypothetical protein